MSAHPYNSRKSAYPVLHFLPPYFGNGTFLGLCVSKEIYPRS